MELCKLIGQEVGRWLARRVRRGVRHALGNRAALKETSTRMPLLSVGKGASGHIGREQTQEPAMTRTSAFISSMVLSTCALVAARAFAAFPYIRMPAASCVVQSGSSSTSTSTATIGATSASNTDVRLICPIATDEPSSYNGFNVHFIDNNGSKAFRANACVDRFSVIGGACSGERDLNSPSFKTPSGQVTEATFPAFSTWQDNFGDFAFIRVVMPARGSCTSGAACWPTSSIRGLFVFGQ
jgi:hypothetical protein